MSTETRTPDERNRLPLLKPAANFFEFVRDNQIQLFPRQIQEGASVFGEWCENCNPDLRLYNETYDEIARKAAFTVHDRCPLCHQRKALDAHWHSTLSIGQRGGKGVLLAAMALYVEHRTLCHPLGLEPGSAVIAIIADTENIGIEITDLIGTFRKQSSWFRDYHTLLTRNKLQKPQAKPGNYHYPHLNLWTRVLPRDTMVQGKFLIFAGLDEPAWFDAVDDQASFAEVLRACNNGCVTVRRRVLQDPTLFGGYVVSVSSPHHVNDTFDKALKRTGERYYSCKIPTWNMHPHYTSEMFDTEFRKNSVSANRDFGVRIVHDSEISASSDL